MRTHRLWRPYEQPSEDEIRSARLDPGDAKRWQQPVVVAQPDPRWPAMFRRVAADIKFALGPLALSVEHVGSTSVAGLPAKPVIDVDLTVADSSNEASYLPQLEAKGFVLTIREPEWEQHRALRWHEPNTILHVFSSGAIEPQRHIAFRNWLTTHSDDLSAYAGLKQQLAGQGFDDVMLYNNAKGRLIYDIYEHIFAADVEHAHDPRPRTS